MSHEYSIATRWKIFVCIFAGVFAAAMVYVGLLPFIKQYHSGISYILFPLLAMAVIFACVGGILDTVKRKLVINDEEVVLISWNKISSLPFDKIKGFRNDDHYFIIDSKEEEVFPSLKISTYFERLDEIKDHFKQNYTDLDADAYEETEKELMQEKQLGFEEEEKILKLKQLKKTATILNIAGMAASAWILFYPNPYRVTVYAVAILPWIVLYAVYKSNGIIKLDEKKNSAYPNASIAFMFPLLCTGLRAMLDLSLLTYAPLLKYIIILSLVFYVLTLAAAKLYSKKKIVSSLLFLLFIAFYSYGLVTEVNSLEDKSTSKVFTATVTNKHISSGKHTSYYLTLSPWGPQKTEDDVDVGHSFYNATQVGQTVHVYLKDGSLGGKWFLVTN